MILACVQSDVTFADVDANLTRVRQHLESAAAHHADLAVMPECMLSGYAYDSREQAWPHSLAIDSDELTQIVQWCGEFDMHVTFGFLERDGERLFNASALLGPSGVIGHYRKVHLPHLGVDRFVDRGDQPFRIMEADGFRVGLAICYDGSFPEPIRLLALDGADIIALGTNWPNGAAHTARIVPPARSMENHLFFVAANRVGCENGFGFCGHSSICGPDGVILAISEDDQPCILYAEVNHLDARNKRIERTPGTHVIDRFKDRRPEFYHGLAEGMGQGARGRKESDGSS